MAEQSMGRTVIGLLGTLVSAAVGGLTGLTAGMTGLTGLLLAAALAVLGAIGAPVAVIIFRRYVRILGAGPPKTPGRRAYDGLRDSLSGDNMAARLYSQWLSDFLDAVDRFFGDAGKADHTLFPHAFGLKTPAPLWTPPAFDRCLMLALIYPIVMVVVFWSISGHVGPAERALGLAADIAPWRRGLSAAAFALAILILWSAAAIKRWVWKSVVVFVVGIAFTAAFTIAFTIAFGLAGVGGAPGGGTGAFLVVFSLSMSLFMSLSYDLIFARASGITGILAVTFAVTLAISSAYFDTTIASASSLGIVVGAGGVIAVIEILTELSIKHLRRVIFLSIFLPVMIATCLTASNFLSGLPAWINSGPAILFLGLLTLINAPFDWASLGLTRALLRRGLELAGWWPYLLAILDAALAAIIVAALALTMVIGVQAFDDLARHDGGDAVLPLDGLFKGITAHPTDPEYWWVYALLLTTVLPSMINLMIGGASLVRGVPGLPRLVLRFLPAGKSAADFDRTWIAAVLTGQIVLGAALGIAAQVLLIVGIVGYVMPWLGLGLLDMARDVTTFNIPARIGQLFSGSP